MLTPEMTDIKKLSKTLWHNAILLELTIWNGCTELGMTRIGGSYHDNVEYFYSVLSCIGYSYSYNMCLGIWIFKKTINKVNRVNKYSFIFEVSFWKLEGFLKVLNSSFPILPQSAIKRKNCLRKNFFENKSKAVHSPFLKLILCKWK